MYIQATFLQTALFISVLYVQKSCFLVLCNKKYIKPQDNEIIKKTHLFHLDVLLIWQSLKTDYIISQL